MPTTRCKAGFTRCTRCHLGQTNGHAPVSATPPATWRAVADAVREHVGLCITKTQAIRIAARLSLTKENRS